MYKHTYIVAKMREFSENKLHNIVKVELKQLRLQLLPHVVTLCLTYTDDDDDLRIEVASSRPVHLPTLSAAKTSKLYLLFKLPFGGGAADAGNATPTFCFSMPAISKLTTLTVESSWTEPTETAKHHILAINEAN